MIFNHELPCESPLNRLNCELVSSIVLSSLYTERNNNTYAPSLPTYIVHIDIFIDTFHLYR